MCRIPIRSAASRRCTAPSKDTIDYVAGVLETEINSPTDNPTVFPEEDMVVSAGNFHGQPHCPGDGFPGHRAGRAGQHLRAADLPADLRSPRAPEIPRRQSRAEQRLHDPAVQPRRPIVSQTKGLCMPAVGRLDPLVAGGRRIMSAWAPTPPRSSGAWSATRSASWPSNSSTPHRPSNSAARPARRPFWSVWSPSTAGGSPFIDNDQVMYPHIAGVGRISA